MSAFDSIFVVRDGERALGCARWLGVRLGASVHELAVDASDAAVKQGIEGHGAALVVIGTAARGLIAHSAVPMLVLPARYREALPWRSMLVAASGEPAADQALEAAARLASALRLTVTVAYCEGARPAAGAVGAYADAIHYEYPGRLSEMVTRALAGATPEESGCVGEVLLCRGDPADELLALASRRQASVLAIGWHGALGAGRATVLKRLLEEAQCPLLVVPQAERPAMRLKVGEAIEGGG